MMQFMFNAFTELKRWQVIALALLLPVLLMGAYLIQSHFYLLDNPSGRFWPNPQRMIDKIVHLATVPDRKTGIPILWQDLYMTSIRMLEAIVFAAPIGFMAGLSMAFFPFWDALLGKVVNFMSNFVIVLLLPLMFVVLGNGEVLKVTMGVLAMVFLIARDIKRAGRNVSRDRLIKTSSMRISQLAMVYRLMLRQVFPDLFASVRLALASGWAMVMVAESVAPPDGVGYRVFLVMKQMDMATIIPYVVIAAVLAYTLDQLLAIVAATIFPWHKSSAHPLVTKIRTFIKSQKGAKE